MTGPDLYLLTCFGLLVIVVLVALIARKAEGLERKNKVNVRTHFPVMPDKSPPGPVWIPWSVAERAYGAYLLRWGKGQSLETIADRGGFYWGEMDTLYPEWRRKASEFAELNAQLTEALEHLQTLVGSYDGVYFHGEQESEELDHHCFDAVADYEAYISERTRVLAARAWLRKREGK